MHTDLISPSQDAAVFEPTSSHITLGPAQGGSAHGFDVEEALLAVAHDLRTPLNTLALLLEELAKAVTAEGDGPALIGICDATLARVRETLDAALTLCDQPGAPHDADTSRMAPVALGPILIDVVEDMAAEIETADAAVELSPSLPAARGDPAMLRSLFQNLLSNAIKFRRDNVSPLIRIAQADAPRGLVAVSVSDNGRGIPETWPTRVIAPFQRAVDAEHLPGHGLGLTQCQRIAWRHGGGIGLKSTAGRGSTFCVYLKAHGG